MYQEVFENIFLVEIPLPNSPLKSLNSYFFRSSTGGRNLIIDSGFNNDVCRAAFFEAMAALGFTMDNTDFFATHLHGDHLGVMYAIEHDIDLYLSRIDVEYLQRRALKNKNNEMKNGDLLTITKLYGMPAEILDTLIKAEFMTSRKPRKNDIIKVDENEIFNVGQYRFETILFPGHTPGHMGLYDKEKKILICGDHILGTISSNITFWEEGFDSLGSYLNSLVVAKQMDVEHLLCGHRSNDFDMYARIDELFEHHANRLSEIIDLLSESGEKFTSYDVASKMTWSVKEDMWNKYSTEQKWFATGEALAHLEYLYKREKIKKHYIEATFYYSI
jgi:glyoxylase-like metal-dependent hydrolase (beta-lactamase superfamily II)